MQIHLQLPPPAYGEAIVRVADAGRLNDMYTSESDAKACFNLSLNNDNFMSANKNCTVSPERTDLRTTLSGCLLSALYVSIVFKRYPSKPTC